MARFDYQRMVHDALRHVVRAALAEVAELGLEGEHHFYIQFRTGHPGVEISPTLAGRYPETMTIVLQNQFWELQADDEGFSVTLSFDRVQEYLRVPYEAVESFADPAAEFGLRFETDSGVELAAAEPETQEPVDGAQPTITAEQEDAPEAQRAAGEVIQIDEFRRK